MIADMLKMENIRIMEEVNDWQDAIHISLEPLLQGGYITENYEKAILECTEKYGPYYVLAEDFALIHGRPEDGVLEKQLAITLLRKPVIFEGSSFPVRVLIALGASDSNSHLDTMKVLSSIFMDEAKVGELVNAEEPQQIYELLITSEENL
ncbi:MAG: PTS sugar transporter subunit IIA [Eubacteriales bacterium]|nr:PTS sugar transporter subunit IIA [Eubacteriales bacterium]